MARDGDPPAYEDALRLLVFTVFGCALAGLSVTLGQTVHPAVGWALPAVVGGVLSCWFGVRWLDELAVRREAARHLAGRPQPEALSIPAGFDPGPAVPARPRL